MNPVVTDLAGNDVQVGDRIAGAFRDSTLAYLRLGTVQSFGERGNKLVMRVLWDRESGPNGGDAVDITGAIEVGLSRFVKLGA